METTYIDHMGTDLSVVNAARVSFAKKHAEFDKEADSRLIRYLAKHNHWSPFAHTAITLHIKAPIFIARQLGKHQVGLVWNEVSRRYVDSEPEFFEPEAWRSRPTGSVKQGSGCPVPYYDAAQIDSAYERSFTFARSTYDMMIRLGVAPEQARMVLPQSMYTEWYWTGSLVAFARVWKERSDPSAQKEVQQVASQISDIIRPLFPISWEALTDG